MSRQRYGSQSTLSRIYDIRGADLALRYHEISERSRPEFPAALQKFLRNPLGR